MSPGAAIPRTTLLVAPAALVAALALSLQGQRLRAATHDSESARARIESLADDARAVLRLRDTAATASEDERPTADVIALVNRVLTAAGVPTSRFQGCSPEGDAAVPGSSDLRRQSVRIALKDMAVADVGAFLAAWRDEGTVWTPTAVEINHAGDERSQAYDAQVVLAAAYHGDPGGRR
ncbi:MAG: hypothetical protein H6674_10895 [Dehalococcoidia bacterium]|nr:hypothetical protein [Dehalococcoidia bacterium]